MAKSHDTRYKKLFNNPRMLEELLTSFVKQDFIKDIDFSTLESLDKSFISDDFKGKESDLIVKFNYKGNDAYLYLLLEFQSTVDKTMPVRVLRYILEFYESLAEFKVMCATKKLPPIFPLVLYNGNQKWNASTNIQELILESEIDNSYIPHFTYHIVAENEYTTEDLMKIENAVSAVFMLENATAADLQDAFKQIINLIRKEPQEIIINLEKWFLDFVGKDKKSQIDIKENFNGLKEVTSMLAATLDEIKNDSLKQGISQGIEQDIIRGIKKGFDNNLINAFTEASFEEIEKIRKRLKE